MKFDLEIDMGDAAFDGKAAAELARILRYWAGNLHHYEPKPGDGFAYLRFGLSRGRPVEHRGQRAQARRVRTGRGGIGCPVSRVAQARRVTSTVTAWALAGARSPRITAVFPVV